MVTRQLVQQRPVVESSSFGIGQHVLVKQKTKEMAGTIIKVNTVTAVVEVAEDAKKWNVPFSMGPTFKNYVQMTSTVKTF